jgi:hypothetical protein
MPEPSRSFKTRQFRAFEKDPGYGYASLFRTETSLEAYIAEHAEEMVRLVMDPNTYVYTLYPNQEERVKKGFARAFESLQAAGVTKPGDWERVFGDLVRTGRWKTEDANKLQPDWCEQVGMPVPDAIIRLSGS